MEYRHVKGPVYCRYAYTPPIINSELALELGIEASSVVRLDEGSNVKLRMVLEDQDKRMTCHAKIDWVKQNQETGDYRVGLSHLSLSDEEFRVLRKSLVEEPSKQLEFGERVTDKGLTVEPMIHGDQEVELKRIKALTLPVAVIEAIDSARGEVPFSEFVTRAIDAYLKQL